MKKYAIIVALIFFCSISQIFPQQDTTKKVGWFPSGVAGLNLSQIALNNWTQGGDNALSWVLNGDFTAKYMDESITFDNTLQIAYGRTKLGSGDFRTNDNDIYLVDLISKNVGWIINPFFSNSVRTAITTGYDYSLTPAQEIANFFDPGYVTQTLGFTYNKEKQFNTRLGIATQETITKNNTKYSDDPATAEVEKFKLETGVESVTNIEYTLAENLLAKSSLRLFTRFKDLSVWDVRWDNAIVAKVNNFINVNFAFLMVYQQDQSTKVQIKEALQLGIVYTIF
jgi:Protein of unknown function (DUF3078)